MSVRKIDIERAGQFTPRTYVVNETAQRFHASNALVRAVMGPVGSGKSSMMVVELLRRAKEQAPGPTNVRRTKFLVVRNTQEMLQTTVVPTFGKWVNTAIFPVMGSPLTCIIRAALSDGTTMESIFMFRGLDDERSLSNLPSLEITGAWISEGSEVTQYDMFAEILARCGRYMADEQPFTWKGLITEYNPPPEGSWLHEKFEIEKPDGYELFKQPPALLPYQDPNSKGSILYRPNPRAENVAGVGGYQYWLDLLKGNENDKAYINQKILGRYANKRQRNPVYTTFSELIHVVPEEHPDPAKLLVMGMDFGLNPAIALTQYDGGIRIIDELTPSDISLDDLLANYLLPMLYNKYQGMQFIAVCDPTGVNRSANDKRDSISIVAKAGIPIVPAITNSITTRIGTVKHYLKMNNGLTVSRNCKTSISAFNGQYRFPKTATGHSNPVKDHPWSDIMDSIQYAALYYRFGGGEAEAIAGHQRVYMPDRNKPQQFLW